MLKPYHGKGQAETPVMTVVNYASKGNSQQGESSQESKEVRKSLRLKNSDILLNSEKKLSHLPEQEKKAIEALLVEFAVLFPDVPEKPVTAHDMDVGNTLSIKQHPYRVNPVKLTHTYKE